MTYYLKSCCDSSFTFTLADYPSSLTLGDVWHVVVPNYFSGCSTVVSSLYPESPTYSYLTAGVTLTGSYNNCGQCTSAYTCNRITGTSECDVITITPMTISCSPSIETNSISIVVSGGTPPYRILWSSGTLGPTLVSPKPNEPYTVTVTDYNWPNGGPDYTATTTCTLIVPSPTPSPTPTPTPTPLPVVYPNLCIQYVNIKGTDLYPFISTGNIVNGKPTWSSGFYTLQWGDITKPYWYVNIGGTVLQNTNPSIPPIGGWNVIGGNSGSATSYTGSCVTPRMSLNSATVSPPTCVNGTNGSIIVNAVNGQGTILYSLDGGITTQTSNTFLNKLAGNYNVWVRDTTPTTLTQSVTVPSGVALTQYNLVMTSIQTPISPTQKKLTFRVFVTNSANQNVTTLPAGTVLTFNIVQLNDFKVANNASFGGQLHTVLVTKNGVNIGITPTTVSSTQTVSTTTAGCVAGTIEYSTATTLTYGGITISGSDVISGTVITTLSKKSNDTCYVKSTDTLSINNVSAAGCSCCNGTSRFVSDPMTINITGTGGIQSTPFTIIKAGKINCVANTGYYFLPNIVSQIVYAPAGLTPLTATVLYSDSALTQPIQTPGPYSNTYPWYYAYNSQIIMVDNGVYSNQDISLGGNC